MKKSEIMIIGDSLTSDMKGGNDAGIKMLFFYNPQGKAIKGDIKNRLRNKNRSAKYMPCLKTKAKYNKITDVTKNFFRAAI
ncbi:MAG: HAD hydrolase-like protein [Anaerotruncus sp.]|nr:MAG: HAD hydrolase-like protein [Anaerotruncus sp.]